MIKIISFDTDGTLLDDGGVDSVFWFEEIPVLYSKRWNKTIEEAKQEVFVAYRMKDRNDPDWYRPLFWFRKFDLLESHEHILKHLSSRVRVYPDAPPCFLELSKSYKLVIVTKNSRDFLNLKLEASGLQNYVSHVYSIIDDFGLTNKVSDVWIKVIAHLDVKPGEIVHVGDDEIFDCAIPKEHGIRAFHLDRTGTITEKNVVHSLLAVPGKITTLAEKTDKAVKIINRKTIL